VVPAEGQQAKEDQNVKVSEAKHEDGQYKKEDEEVKQKDDDKDEEEEEEDVSLVIDEANQEQEGTTAGANTVEAKGDQQEDEAASKSDPALASVGKGDEDADGDEEEKDFEPSIDMIVNDYDDEVTMEEEEALADEDVESAAAEAEALEQEADMPLEELLKKYGYQNDNANGSTAEEESAGQEDGRKETATAEDKAKEDQHEKSEDASSSSANASEQRKRPAAASSASPQSAAKKSKSELARFYEATVEGRSLRSTAGGQNDDDDEDSEGGHVGGDDSDGDGSGREYSWKKTIMIGPSYQACVPAGLSAYDDSLPYENEDKLLWDPKELSSAQVEDFLASSSECAQPAGVASLPSGAHTRDDEQALYLLQQCGNNVEEALRRWRFSAIPAADTLSLWSEDECRAFELGLRLYGKDFHMIQQQRVRTRSVGELVQFYYLWKKTERHDVFANATRLEKKKYTLHPGEDTNDQKCK